MSLLGLGLGEFFVVWWSFFVVVVFYFYRWGKRIEMIPFLLKPPI